MNWIPEPKIYSISLSYATVKRYGYLIGINYFKRECSLCHKLKNIQCHHKNENKWDNRLENLQIVCAKCHLGKIHAGSKKWKDKAKRQSATMHKKYLNGEISPWNKGLTIAMDNRLVEYGKKQSVTKSLHPMKLSKKHISILVKTAHSPEARQKRSVTVKRVWQERKNNGWNGWR